ncbi:hypothetical protein MAHJHV58_00210 [Mycobacterium avium subsp. hominissuis]|uniref:type VII secretion target n=1 Tax=Mycobacterium avium TaxID=1764 RepID=UPI000447DFB7|nr:type VII secretion target [Mycobacterium avium]ETZ55293.1 hypothetical protein L838_0949 [Mycobacterium avium MAV_120709_2344]MCA4736666.1 hypothetical protein [Mycobacterium avium subsp. hominissuis]MCA4741241.1 hypothetical protein [Mycobacterium avium subsp. hominissuis]MCA4745954.1 hypothetical protein [Mycobacterium avium subsp. hominissuis]MCA4766114.1 hypothetical protein [Mycobacterium avium subsp. hominissuis]
MADMKVSTDELRQHAGTFDATAEDHAVAGRVDHSGVEADIASFGEINSCLHDQYRAVKQLQADAWSASARNHTDHADKVRTAAAGYDSTEAAGAGALGSTDL